VVAAEADSVSMAFHREKFAYAIALPFQGNRIKYPAAWKYAVLIDTFRYSSK
jgi:hypothetical protein